MGKRGIYKLVMPKNNASLEVVEQVLISLRNHGGVATSKEIHIDLEKYYKRLGKKLDATSISHRLATPRYFGLMVMEKGRGNICQLTDMGDAFINCKTKEEKIDLMFSILKTVKFGRNNNAVSSDSNIEPPCIFLKVLNDIDSATLNQMGSLIYKMDFEKTTYADSLNFVATNPNINAFARDIYKNKSSKFFDLKFNLLFADLGIVNVVKIKGRDVYSLPTRIKAIFGDVINEQLPLYNTSTVKDPTTTITVTKTASGTLKAKPTATTVDVAGMVAELLKQPKPNDPDIKKPSYYHYPTGKVRLKRIERKIGEKTSKPLTSKDTNLIGLYGEHYINYLLTSKNKALLDLILDSSENIVKIDWFNNGCVFDGKWEDKSVGKGCDFEITTNKSRTLKLEVKTSFSNVSFLTATGNELVSMEKDGDDYYLIKIDNIKSKKPSLKIIKNPIKSFVNLSNVKDATFYI